MFGWLRAKAPASPETPRPFGYKAYWLAVQADDALSVAQALSQALGVEPRQPRSCAWSDGIGQARGGFVTPPLRGWVLVVGLDAPESGEDQLSLRVSERLNTQVYGFGSHRGIGFVNWSWAERGRLLRYYSASEDGVESLGEALTEERALGLLTPQQAESLADGGDEAAFDRIPDEDTVIHLAGHYTVDPTKLGRPPFDQPSVGLLI